MQVEVATDRASMAQIFWNDSQEKDGFTEQKSYHVSVVPEQQRYGFVLPALSSVRSLRLDLSSSQHPILLKNIVVLETGGEAVRFETPADMMRVFSSLHDIKDIVPQEDGLLIVPSGNDPQLGMNVDALLSRNCSHLNLRTYLWLLFPLLVASLLLTFTIKKLFENRKRLIYKGLPTALVKFKTYELLVALFIIAIVLYYLCLWFYAAATTSLWTDELYTIGEFSSKGPVAVLTDYHAPNNHIFFNLINSLLPAADSYFPLRARFLSIMAVVGCVFASIVFYFRQGRYLAGALVVLMLGASWEHLNLMLQARGYGLITLSSVMICLSLFRYLKNRHRRDLATLVAFSVIGCWTIPSFVFFAAPVLGLLYFLQRDRASFIAVFVFALLLLAVYLPLIDQIIAINNRYEGKWGGEYGSISAVFETVRSFLLPGATDWQLFLFFCGSVILPYILWRKSDMEGRTWQVLLAAVLFFFLSSLYLKTPPLRAAAFVVLPLGMVSVACLTKLYENRYCKWFRPLVCIAMIAFSYLVVMGKIAVFNRYYVPLENWYGSSRLIDAIFPEQKKLYCNFRPRLLQKYLKGNYHFLNNDLDIDGELFSTGNLVVIDSHPWKEKRFDYREYISSGTEIIIPQKRGDFHQKISFVVSDEEKIDKVNIMPLSKPLAVSDIDQYFSYIDPLSMSIDMTEMEGKHSLNIVGTGLTVNDIVSVTIREGNMVNELSKEEINMFFLEGRKWLRNPKRFGSVITLALHGKLINECTITFAPWDSKRRFTVQSIWVQ